MVKRKLEHKILLFCVEKNNIGLESLFINTYIHIYNIPIKNKIFRKYNFQTNMISEDEKDFVYQIPLVWIDLRNLTLPELHSRQV